MKFGFVRIGAVSPKIALGDPQKNVAVIVREMQKAERLGINLLCFPELCLTGATAGDLFLNRELAEASNLAMQQIASQTKDLSVFAALGAPVNCGTKTVNAYMLIGQGSTLKISEKTNFSGVGIADQSRYFDVENKDDTLLIEAFGTLISVCFYDDLAKLERSTSAGAEIVLCPSAIANESGKEEFLRMERRVLSARAHAIMVFVNAGGGESVTDAVYTGGCAIAECGELLCEGAPCSAEIAFADVDIAAVRYQNRAKKRRIAETIEIKKLKEKEDQRDCDWNRVYSKYPFILSNYVAQATEIFQLQAEALSRRILHTGAKVVVVGVSGGLDSTLALLVAVNAMKRAGRTAQDVVAVTMPGGGTSGRTYQNALALMKLLEVQQREISIKTACESHLKDLGHGGQPDVAFENAQARERTQILMDLSNMLGGFVVGTGDLSELALGFATYNGDHMSMYGVNASIPKTLMRSMLTVIAEKLGGELELVIKNVVDTPVSPELLPAVGGASTQVTEEIVGPYVLHDFFLYHFLKNGMNAEKLYAIATKTFAGDFSAEDIKHWQNVFFKRFFQAQFKRSCMPDGAAVTGFSLSPRGGASYASDINSQLFQLK